MRRRVTAALLLLYPRRVRRAHGAEILSLIDDLVAHDGRSPAGLFLRLAADGVVQRMTSTATAWTVAAVLAATSCGGLAVSDLAAAGTPRTTRPGFPHAAGGHGRAAHRRDRARPRHGR